MVCIEPRGRFSRRSGWVQYSVFSRRRGTVGISDSRRFNWTTADIAFFYSGRGYYRYNNYFTDSIKRLAGDHAGSQRFKILEAHLKVAIFIAPDGFFASRRGQFVTLSARDRIPTSCGNRDMVEAGLLMSYGTVVADMFRQVGIYTGNILIGAKPADLPVLQSTKFEFVINLQTARALGIEVSNSIQLLADEIIE
jgi:hypothetical protein